MLQIQKRLPSQVDVYARHSSIHRILCLLEKFFAQRMAARVAVRTLAACCTIP
jgi:hypothetical protein